MSSTLSSPPPGGDEDRGPLLLTIFWTESTLSILIVASRFYSRWSIKALGADDATMLATLVFPTTPFIRVILIPGVAGAASVLRLWHRLRSRWRGPASFLSFPGSYAGPPSSQTQLDQPAFCHHESWPRKDLRCISDVAAHRDLRQGSKDIPMGNNHSDIHFQRSVLHLDLRTMHSDQGTLGACSRGYLLGSGHTR